MQSEIKVGQRFEFNVLSDNPSRERQAVVTRVLTNNEEGLGPEVDFYLAYWVEAYELPETEAPTTLVFERGIDGNVYFTTDVRFTHHVAEVMASVQERDGGIGDRLSSAPPAFPNFHARPWCSWHHESFVPQRRYGIDFGGAAGLGCSWQAWP